MNPLKTIDRKLRIFVRQFVRTLFMELLYHIHILNANNNMQIYCIIFRFSEKLSEKSACYMHISMRKSEYVLFYHMKTLCYYIKSADLIPELDNLKISVYDI